MSSVCKQTETPNANYISALSNHRLRALCVTAAGSLSGVTTIVEKDRRRSPVSDQTRIVGDRDRGETGGL